MRFVFAGTTEFGIPTLEKLMDNGHELLFVITQPDKPVGRKQQLSPPPIKTWALERGIPVLQPQKIQEAAAQIMDSKPDLLLVAAYGQIIPKQILDLPNYGSVNIHGSILPKYRGASPIQAALLNGENKTGITLIKMDEKMDHGPILSTSETEILQEYNFESLYKKLSEVAADLSADTLPKFVAGQIIPHEQDHSAATFTKLINRGDARIDWTKSARQVLNQVRALNPQPGTWTTLEGRTIKILGAEVIDDANIDLPGGLAKTTRGLKVKCSDKNLLVIRVQPEGKNPMSGADFANGIKDIDRKHFI